MLIPALCALLVSGSDPSEPAGPIQSPSLYGLGDPLEPAREREWQDPMGVRTFTVGTSDSSGLVRWLERRRWVYRSLGQGLFEVDASPDSLDSLANLPGIDRIEAPPRQELHALDASRERIHADPVHKGTDLARPHRGTKALVGIIDVGFDLKHPTFLDSTGKSRIIRVWDQTNTSGRPPAGFNSGTLFTTPEAIQQLGRTKTQATHGTHVAGLAAGREVKGTPNPWWGVADDARIALVDCGDGCRGINDGIKYLFRLADSLKMPVAVNMSWGTLNGPRNGNSSDCVTARSLVGPGKIIVVSAGNSGGKAAHAKKAFNNDTARFALQLSKGTQTLSSGATRTSYFNEVEFWGDSARTYKAWIEYLGSDDALLGTSPVFSVGASSTWQNINSNFRVGADTVWYSGNMEKRSGQAGLRLSVSTSRSGTQLRMVVAAANGTVHGWIWEDGLAFLKLASTRCKGCVVPDSFHVISDKATCPAVVSVAAISGSNGQKASFTSRGPGLGVAPKPDIASPGMSIVSSLNSGYPGTSVTGTYGGFPWGPMSGTSMSAPLVTGTVALLLETNPKLAPPDVIALFKGTRTAHSADTGWARLDVLGLIRAAESPSSVAHTALAPAIAVTRTWIAADGRRVAIPAGAEPWRFHPGGIAWIQTCEAGLCTTRGAPKLR